MLIYKRCASVYTMTSLRSVITLSLDDLPTNAIYYPNAGLMLGQRLRRWPNINTALGQCIVFNSLVTRDIPIINPV